MQGSLLAYCIVRATASPVGSIRAMLAFLSGPECCVDGVWSLQICIVQMTLLSNFRFLFGNQIYCLNHWDDTTFISFCVSCTILYYTIAIFGYAHVIYLLWLHCYFVLVTSLPLLRFLCKLQYFFQFFYSKFFRGDISCASGHHDTVPPTWCSSLSFHSPCSVTHRWHWRSSNSCYNSIKPQMVEISPTGHLNPGGILFPAQAGRVNRSTGCKTIFVFSIFSHSILFIHDRLRKDKFVFVFLRNCEACVLLYISTCAYYLGYLGMENCWEIVRWWLFLILFDHLGVVPQLVSRCHYTV